CGAAVDLAFGPNPAPMSAHDPLDDRQPDAGAFELLLQVQALKHAEQFVHIFHVKADAVVFDKVRDCVWLSIIRQPADFDLRYGSRARVFKRIRQEIAPHELQQTPVSLARRKIGYPQIDVPAFLRRLEFDPDLSCERVHFDRTDVHADPTEAGELQEIVDQLARLPRRFLDDPQATPYLGIQARSMVLFHHANKNLDRDPW